MSRLAATLRRSLLVACLATVPGACAVMRIDVDVYKGPLANEEDIQIEQFSAMAIGAKALLIELRDVVQFKETGEKLRQERNAARTAGWYRDDYIPQKYSSRLIPEALRVNAILFLYKDADLKTKGLREFIVAGDISLKSYEKNYAVVEPEPKRDEKIWKEIW